MSLFNCEINFILTSSANCLTVDEHVNNQVQICAIIDTKLYVLVVTLSTQENAKLLKQLKLDFTTTINWYKHRSNVTQHGAKIIFILLN